jgi:hypothetical protein
MTPKPIEDLSAAELRREIAAALGFEYSAVPDEDGDGNVYYEDVWYKDGKEEAVPDWPEDPGAALVLCVEIARELHVHKQVRVMIQPLEIIEGLQFPDPVRVSFVEWAPQTVSLAPQDLCLYPDRWQAEGDTLALAASRLACAALRAQGGGDD